MIVGIGLLLFRELYHVLESQLRVFASITRGVFQFSFFALYLNFHTLGQCTVQVWGWEFAGMKTPLASENVPESVCLNVEYDSKIS